MTASFTVSALLSLLFLLFCYWVTVNRYHWSWTPRSVCMPRSSNAIPELTTRSFTAGGAQRFVVALTPSAPIAPVDLAPAFVGTDVAERTE